MEATMFHLIKDFSDLTLINLAYCWKFRNSISLTVFCYINIQKV